MKHVGAALGRYRSSCRWQAAHLQLLLSLPVIRPQLRSARKTVAGDVMEKASLCLACLLKYEEPPGFCDLYELWSVGCLVFPERKENVHAHAVYSHTSTSKAEVYWKQFSKPFSLKTRSHASGDCWHALLNWEKGEESLIGNWEGRRFIWTGRCEWYTRELTSRPTGGAR